MSGDKYATPFELLHSVSLLSQRSRIQKFAESFSQVIEPGMTVADIGTGTGILALLAAKAGAAKVVGIDVNEKSIEYARKAAALNGCEDIIDFQVAHFSDFKPVERFDVVVCEMLSSMMLIEQQIPASLHITQNILKQDGILLPESVAIYGILGECEEIFDRFVFQNLRFPKLPQTAEANQIIELSEMEKIIEFDLKQLDDLSTVDKELEYTIIKDGVVHGLLGSFEAVLHDSIVLHLEDGWREILIPFGNSRRVTKEEKVPIRLTYTPGKFDTMCLDWNDKINIR